MAVRRRRGRAVFAAILTFAAVAALLSVLAPRAQARAAATARVTDGQGWSADAWAAREKALDTDEQAVAYARDLGGAYQASVPLPAPGFLIEGVRLLRVQRFRGDDGRSVWTADYAVQVRSAEVTGYSVSYLQHTRFGPGLHPGDVTQLGVEDVLAFADLQKFSAEQRRGILSYFMSIGNPRPMTIARLDIPFPGAPWYEDTPMRADLLARGKAHGMGASQLAWVVYADGQSGLCGYRNGTWISLGK